MEGVVTDPASFQCRACGVVGADLLLSLGSTPLANALLTDEELDAPEPRYPLDVVLCRGCALVQLADSVPPEQLFREYPYFSSFSETVLQHAAELSARLTSSRALGPHSLVVEIASNDGYLLQNYARDGVPVLGIDPARNVAAVAETHGVPTISEFFGEHLGARLASQGRRADVVHAHNVLAHVPDIAGFIRGVAHLLKDDGLAVVEVPYVRDLIDRCEFDTIYHEHLSYFSLTAVDRVFRQNGLVLHRVERVPIHGGSLRLFAQPNAGNDRDRSVDALLDDERRWRVDRLETYQAFGHRVEALRRSLVDLLGELKRQGKRIAAYGAAAKGSTLLNYARLGRDVLDFVVDRSTYKQGKYMPGVRLPIYAPAKLVEERPDCVLLLAWNFADEILAQQAEYRRGGGRFILPIPEARIV